MELTVPKIRSIIRDYYTSAQTLLVSILAQNPSELVVNEQRVVGRITGGDITGLTPAQLVVLTAGTHPLANTYVSGSGTAGADGTAQDVKTVVVPANTLTQVNDRLRIRTYWKGDTGGGITGTTKINTVMVAEATDGGGADFFTTEAWLHYLDNTHANIIETGAYPTTGANSAENVAGFDWASDQNVVISQDNVANNHIIVYCIFLDVFPLGVT